MSPTGAAAPDHRVPAELQRAAAALYAVVDAAAAVYTAATGRLVHRPGTEVGPGAEVARLTATADYAAALNPLDRCVHSAPPEYVAEAARRYLVAVTDATAAPDLDNTLTALRASLAEHDAAEADVAALIERNRTKRRSDIDH